MSAIWAKQPITIAPSEEYITLAGTQVPEGRLEESEVAGGGGGGVDGDRAEGVAAALAAAGTDGVT